METPETDLPVLVADDSKEEEMLNELFKDRYTETDKVYMEFASKPLSSPPTVHPWKTKSREMYKRGHWNRNRDRRGWSDRDSSKYGDQRNSRERGHNDRSYRDREPRDYRDREDRYSRDRGDNRRNSDRYNSQQY